MSSSPGRREVAHRLFAAEFDDADFSYSESDEERAPNYVVTPSGARVNRLFLVGVLTEVERVNEEMLRARMSDPTGAFVVYAGQYQPDELAFLERAEPPTFLAVTGKARTFEPEDGNRVFTSVRPESINEVDAETRDRWAVNAVERTLERVGTMAAALESNLSGEDLRAALADAGVDESLAAGIPLALDHYGTTPDYLAALRELSLDVARLIADEIDEVGPFDAAPDEGDGDASALADPDLTLAAPASTPSTRESTEAAEEPASEPGPESETVDVEAESDSKPEPVADSASGEETTATEPTATGEEESETTTEAGGNDIGDFEPGEFDTGDEGGESAEDVLDEEERRELQEEYGTEFSTASEVEEPGETADEPETEPAPDAEAVSGADSEPEPEPPEEPDAEEQEPTDEEPVEAEAEPAAAEPDDAPSEAPAEDVSVEDAVMDAMADFDDGDGADRDAVVDRATERTGASVDEVEDTIQDLLMSGQCYEPDDGRLKPI